MSRESYLAKTGIKPVLFEGENHIIPFEPGIITFDSVTLIRQRANPWMEGLLERIKKNEKGSHLFPSLSNYKPDVRVIKNCFVDPSGLIQNVRSFGFGACYATNLLLPDSNDSRTIKRPILLPSQDVPYISKVVSICGLWAGNTWHFAAESLPSLMYFDKWPKRTFLHVSRVTPWITQWIAALHITIPMRLLVTGPIYAKKLIIPRQGQCGEPYPEQIFFLRDIAVKAASIKAQLKNPYLLLVKRSGRRPTKNFEHLFSVCQHYCHAYGLDVKIHDDSCLPPLEDQIAAFRDALIVAMPHGAAGVLAVACNPKSLIIEFLNDNSPSCYIRNSYYLGLTHLCLSSVDNYCDVEALSIALDSWLGEYWA